MSISSGAFNRRNRCSATSSIFQITAWAFSTFLNRLAASVRSRRAANGDSTGLVVRRCCHCLDSCKRSPSGPSPARLLSRQSQPSAAPVLKNLLESFFSTRRICAGSARRPSLRVTLGWVNPLEAKPGGGDAEVSSACCRLTLCSSPRSAKRWERGADERRSLDIEIVKGHVRPDHVRLDVPQIPAEIGAEPSDAGGENVASLLQDHRLRKEF